MLGRGRSDPMRAVVDQPGDVAATADECEFMPPKGVRADSATARPRPFRRAAIPGIRTGRV